MGLRISLVAAMLSATCVNERADSPAAPANQQVDLRSIGGGLYVLRDAKFTPDNDGNVMVMVFSRQPLAAGPGFSFNLETLGVASQNEDPWYDGGEFGPVRALSVTINCATRTYEVIDTRRLLPAPLWRVGTTLPALAPVFTYVCSLT